MEPLRATKGWIVTYRIGSLENNAMQMKALQTVTYRIGSLENSDYV